MGPDFPSMPNLDVPNLDTPSTHFFQQLNYGRRHLTFPGHDDRPLEILPKLTRRNAVVIGRRGSNLNDRPAADHRNRRFHIRLRPANDEMIVAVDENPHSHAY
jgi:hypothetical protein